MKPIQLTHEQRQEMDRRRKASHDRRLYERLTAVLAVAAGKPRGEVADLLGVGLTQLSEWLRIYCNRGLEALCSTETCHMVRAQPEQADGPRLNGLPP